MPILDPSLQCCLLKNFNKNYKTSGINFLLYYLRIASRNMNRNISTIETSILFKNDLKKSILFVNNELGCNFKVDQDFNFSISDFYKHLYDSIIISSDKERKSKIQKGSFYACDDQFNTKFFQPCVFYSEQHAWFFSDTPTAILCINDKQMRNGFKELVKLEIDLMAAAGFVLVLCGSCTPNTLNFYLELIRDNQFAEIHLNIFDDSYASNFIKEINKNEESHLNYFKGYFYLYSHFAGPDVKNIIKKFKKRPRFKMIFTCEPLENTFKTINLVKTKPFLYYKTGFKSEYLRIRLSNVPLYDHANTYSNFVSTQVSGLSLAYISPSDFSKWSKKRIKILFDDRELNGHHTKKYVNFGDIHEMKADLYVNKTLYLMDISKKKLKEVNNIKSKIDTKFDENKIFKKETIFSLFQDRKIIEGLEYVGYAYTKCFIDKNSDFSLHEAQLLTALEACKTFVKKIDSKEDKGMIYQVETGEGKSCIVCLIAAVLALMKRSVHITSSNINLANRDYCRSFNFFKMLGFESAILLHDNELPYSLKKKNNLIYNSNTNISLSSNALVDDAKDDFFGTNSSSYFENNVESESSAFKIDYYPDKFFKADLFKNPSRMNFSVCGIDNNNKFSRLNQANIVFSTFVNFECLYLRMMETCRGLVDEYFQNCGLLVDEVDSILIDEITNGTIVSREMKSNAKPILKYVYKQHMDYDRKAEDTYKNIRKYWPNCGSLKLLDVIQMYEEIDLVNEDEFTDGKKYLIKSFQVKNSSRIKRFLKKTSNFVKKTSEKIEEAIEKVKSKADEIGKEILDDIKGVKKVKININDNGKDNEADDDDEEEDDENDFEDEEEEIADGPVIEFKHIIPFDYDHKGILEPNKEFSGFIQQFIAIKEGMKNGNENMIIKDLAMNYLYVSHPIFAKLYGKVCGFTGTIGKGYERKIYSDSYGLKTSKVPRHSPNLRVELPMILCEDFDERNSMIVDEVKAFHDKGYPVLVIFQDLKEIDAVEYLLNSKDINYINIFDGTNEYIKPDKIAGTKGAVSLGTNVCGRGTDILIQSNPLHVIVTYYSSNSRVMRQAYGRTARQGQKGTYRVICVKDQFYNPSELLDGDSMGNAINDFGFKNKQQENFIDHFKKHRPWIFSGDIKRQRLNKSQIGYMRETKINVNRIVAFNYKFPICMKIKTFLKIQAQKIFSIFNCPNSKYTWILFQRYLREMILESWSLMLNKLDRKFIDRQGTPEYNLQLINRTKKLYKQIEDYIPTPKKLNDADIIPTFMRIYKIVKCSYQKEILNIYKAFPEAYKQFNSEGFCSCQFGFRPYSLLTNSGARIDSDNIGEMNYIIDPELRYEQACPNGKFTILSITQKIDEIFNLICQKINETLGEKIGLKFFLRRTLGGCEFGLCFDAVMEADDPKNPILNDYYCLIDKDPLLLFTIFVKNAFPILAGVLIIVLVYIASISTQIIAWISAFPAKLSEEILKKGLKMIIEFAGETLISKILESLTGYLEDIVDDQIAEIMKYDKVAGLVFSNLFKIFKDLSLDNLGDKFSDFLGCKIKVKTRFGRFLKDKMDYGLLLKFGLYLIICIGSFMMHFNHSNQSIKNEAKNAKEFNKNCTPNTAEKLKEKNKNKVKLNKIKNKANNDSKLNHGLEEFKGKSHSFLFLMNLTDPSKFKVNRNDFKTDLQPISKKNKIGNAYITYHIQLSNPRRCFQIQYFGNTKSFKQEVVLYSTFQNPIIAQFVGFYAERKNDFVLLEMYENGFLDDYINKKDKDILWSPSAKLIIAYGIAYVMNYLHEECHVIHRDLNPSNICLDRLFYPYLYNFYHARQVDKPEPIHLLIETSIRFMAPEFIENPELVQNSFKIDVFSYGMLMFNVLSEKVPFENYTAKEEIMNAVVNGERPEFTPSIHDEWRELISKCWDQDPNKRPSFQMILNELGSRKFVNNHVSEKIFTEYKNKIQKK